MNVGAPWNLDAMHVPRFLTNSHTSVSQASGYAGGDCMSWGWAVWMWAGGGACWQVNFTGQHSFCIFGQPALGSPSSGNSVVASFTFMKGQCYVWEGKESCTWSQLPDVDNRRLLFHNLLLLTAIYSCQGKDSTEGHTLYIQQFTFICMKTILKLPHLWGNLIAQPASLVERIIFSNAHIWQYLQIWSVVQPPHRIDSSLPLSRSSFSSCRQLPLYGNVTKYGAALSCHIEHCSLQPALIKKFFLHLPPKIVDCNIHPRKVLGEGLSWSFQLLASPIPQSAQSITRIT